MLDTILFEHCNLDKDTEIRVNYTSGKSSNIYPDDILEIVNDNIKVARHYKGEWLCTLYIDTAKVESIIIIKRREY